MNENKLLKLRNKKHLLQKEVAEAIGVTTSYYGMLETGIRKPSIKIAFELAKFFNTSIEEIFFQQ